MSEATIQFIPATWLDEACYPEMMDNVAKVCEDRGLVDIGEIVRMMAFNHRVVMWRSGLISGSQPQRPTAQPDHHGGG